jgi:hypothetical protein
MGLTSAQIKMALFIDLVPSLTSIAKNQYFGGINSTANLIVLHTKTLKQFTSIAFNHVSRHTMKYTLTLICSILFQSLYAQLPPYSTAPDFTATDINGTYHNLQSYLDQGKTVLLHIDATWNGPGWSFFTQGILEDVYNTYGPNGTNEMMVFMVEGDPSTGLSDLYGTSANTQGDWVTGTPYPIIDDSGIADSYSVYYFPTVYLICPSGILWECGQSSDNGNYWTAEGLHDLIGDCPNAIYSNDPAILQCNTPNATACGVGAQGTITPQAFLMNLGTAAALTSATIKTYRNGILINTNSWTGNLSVYESAWVNLSPLNVSENDVVTCRVENGSDMSTNNNEAPVNFVFSAIGSIEASAPLYEGLEDSNFPSNGWSVWDLSNNGGNWYWNNQGQYGMDGAALFDFYSAPAGEEDDFISPSLDFSGLTEVYCNFAYTKANYASGQGPDKLDVRVSTNCGNTWTTVWSRTSPSLDTEPATDSYYLPTANTVWATASADLSQFAGQSDVLVAFHAVSGYGNLLHIDNITIDGTNGGVVYGCTNSTACNYNPSASNDDGSCILQGSSCNDNNPNTFYDQFNGNCQCAGFYIQTDCADEIFISEYVEGTANNKAIELYNPSSEPIVLTGVYSMGRDRDGSGVPMLIDITGVIEPHGVRVFALDKRDPSGTGNEVPISPLLEAVADTFLNPVYVQSNSPMYYNGDDAFVLVKNGNQIVDIVGEIGYDPGSGWWQLGDPNTRWWTVDNSMVRKPQILQGVTVNPAEFDPSLEWDTLSVDDFSHLGWHETICAQSITGCTNIAACNYNPSAVSDNGSCLFYGAACNDGNPLTSNDIVQGNCSCYGTYTSTNCGASDYDFGSASYGIYPAENTALIDGCIDESYYQPFYVLVPADFSAFDPANTGLPIANYTINSMTIGGNPISDYGLSYTCLNNDCVFEGGGQYCLNLSGIPNQTGTFEVALNASLFANVFGSLIESPFVLSTYTLTISADCSPEIPGCTNFFACNYNAAATVNDGSCLVIGSACNDFNPNTVNDVIQSNCNCAGTPIDPGCSGFTVSNNTANPTCAGLNNGFISVNTSGTSAPFSYSWNNGSTSSSITNIGAGAYSVMITDAVGCTETINFNITAPAALNANTTANAANCYGAASGSASALVSGGTAPYAYAWNTSPIQNTAQIDNVAAGIYTVNITDANGCVFSSSATISQPTQPLVVSATSTSASCSQSDGSASAVVTGNTAAIQYLWSNGQTGATASNLSAGAYTVTITSGGCSAHSTVNVNNINAPVINHVSSSPACFGANTGSINTIVTGGTQPYQYLWSNGGVGTAQSGLTAGTYTFIVIDNANCQSSIVVTLTQPNPLNVALTATPTSCSGTPQGTVNATVSGGTQPYLYSWSNGSGGTAINNLNAGQYSLSITDANGCSTEASAQVINPDGVMAYAIDSDLNCFGGTNGAVEVIITDGTPPFTYEWNNGITGTALITELTAGDYSCVVTDANGCSFTATETVDQPQGNMPEILGQISVNPFSTETYSTAWQEGYDYSWTATGGNVLVGPNSNFIEVQWGASGTGEVTLTMTDGTGCDIITTLVVSIGGQSISEDYDNAIRIFPVPLMDHLTIQAPQEFHNVPFAIYDAVGKVIVSGKITQEINVLPVHQLASGTYMLKLNQQTFQLVKL